MLTLLAAIACSDPEPTSPSEPELPSSEQEDPTLTDAPPELELGAPIALPWPELLPCKEFGRVVVSGAYLERPDGTLLPTQGQPRARRVPPTDFVQGLSIRADLTPVHITASCADPRERVIWSCTQDNGCTLEQQRIGEPPTLPGILADLDSVELAKEAPSAAQLRRIEPMVLAGIQHSLALLEDCQSKGCQSEGVMADLSAWSGPLPEPTVLDGPPWKVIYRQGQTELHFSCQPHVCSLRTVGPTQTRLDLRAGAQSLYVIPGRLDYRDEGSGPRVAYSGRLVGLKPQAPAPASAPE